VSIRTAPTLEEVRGKREEILRVLAAEGAHSPRVFGSVARGDAVADSDVDLMVEFRRPLPTGFRYFGLIYDLQEAIAALLGRPVHVVQIDDEKSETTDRILREAVPL
jgi:predicted nucleotidyltransferase